MWHALRAELVYFRNYLFGSLGIALGVALLLSVILMFDDGPPDFAADGLRGMFLILGPMIVGFIMQGLRSEERRSRLLLMGPITPRQMAGVMVLLPVVLFAIGVVAAGMMIGFVTSLSGRFEPESLNMVGFVGGQLFTYVQLALLVQEAAAAKQQGRRAVAAAGWGGFVLACLLLALLYLFLFLQVLIWAQVMLGHFVISALAMAMSVFLYSGRSDFTR